MIMVFRWFKWFKRPPAPSPVIPKPPAPSPPINLPPTNILEELLQLHNNIRNSYLSLNDQLNLAAQKHAEWMAKNTILSHTGSNGSSFWNRIEKEGYKPKTGGENIAYGYDSAVSVFNGWMNSKGHKNNIMNDSFEEVGFGVSSFNNGPKYWCASFATQFYNTNDKLDLSIVNMSFPIPLGPPINLRFSNY